MKVVALDKCPRIETDRLVLRKWEPRDLDGLYRLNTDPKVGEFFRTLNSPEETPLLLEVHLLKQQKDGFCFPVIEDRATGAFLGFCGFNVPLYQELMFFEPCIEMGWCLIPEAWGKGIAVEAANIWLKFGFETLQLEEIVSFTVVQNHRSRRVMDKLGMVHDPAEDFDFPGVETDDPLCRHALYRLSKERYFRRLNDRDIDREMSSG
ncbi:hypothetical protein PsW64_02641 [Pseudovibrio sp. W64]|uniref:GNAT family N-acetyltransferase n=1 Tax=Pseudovibrio sp. W64 TaxID=1735583 RepID=UPI0007AE58AC|nr:GNAT family N-acetyltransferase [Pseudovibrio sp. W64]KZK80960.1 hypothetical protein PsW64_02641 [Pseudovibrio sp. W64]